jgi:hypothetical protein
MSFKTVFTLENIKQSIKELRELNKIANPMLVEELEDYTQRLSTKMAGLNSSWQDFKAFWPPRCVDALKRHQAVVFFGAGLSFSCGLPSWNDLLSEHFGLDKALTDDTELANDPLTLAELASQHLGSEVIQGILRKTMNEPHLFSVNHAVLAALRCPMYITTNYDCLFEKAWREMNSSELLVVTNDSNMLTKDFVNAEAEGRSILFKIHGSSDKLDEYMILTRRDYRFHYRTNDKLFKCIRKQLKEKHTIFVGFSHKDPEVSRLVEDAIYDYEKTKPKDRLIDPRPQFYSLQFGMNSHAPEVFAARGIVALQPPHVTTSIENVRTKGLAVALIDLVGSKENGLHCKVALDDELQFAIKSISDDITCSLQTLSNYVKDAEQTIISRPSSNKWIESLTNDLGDFASQGVYLLDDKGFMVDLFVPAGLSLSNRRTNISLSSRRYFQQAKSFRESFLSDSDRSIFNGNSTFFVCKPVLKNEQSVGLLFSAVQIGQWKTPLNVAKKLWDKGYSFSLIDSNGVCLLPPRNEFQLCAPNDLLPGELADSNYGYPYLPLLELSRRDLLVRHLSKSVVPVTQDDDVLELARDSKEFSVVSEVPQTRWKVAISLAIHTDTMS